MVIDLAALRAAAVGDPDAKVTVRRAWLATVLAELEDLERRRVADRPDQLGPAARRLAEAFTHLTGATRR